MTVLDNNKCNFDWKKFHNMLDVAVAHMISEGTLEKPVYPSNTSIMQLLTYSCDKVKSGGCFPKKKIIED